MDDILREQSEKQFLAEKGELMRHNKNVEEVILVNKYLKQFNWAFIHPYLIGGHIKYFADLEREGQGSRRNIFTIFSKYFFDLQTTTSLIEGIFKKRVDLAPFCHLIDQSVFMCLQRDYAGAINTLLPVIEGSIRHHLVVQRGMTNGAIKKTKTLLSVFAYLKEDYLSIQRNYYQNHYRKARGSNIDFTEEQVQALVKCKEVFIDMWFGIITEYLEKNLYLDTRDTGFGDILNRHVIFHGFTADIYYNLENYLKIFNCITFLSYAYGMADVNGRILIDIENDEILDKWVAFEKIRVISWTATAIKSTVYSDYPDFDAVEYSEDIFDDPLGKEFKQMFAWSLEHRLRRVEELIRKAVSKNRS
jgi:hypothetical protein